MDPAVYAILFLALGTLLLVIEVVLIPGVGLVGLMGGGLMTYGMYIAWANYGPVWGITSVVGGGLAAGLTIFGFLRSPLSRRLVLQNQQSGEPSDLPQRARELVGQRGMAETDLRPSGIARLGTERLDVVASEGEYIDKGTAVEVVRIAQNSVIVHRILENEGDS
jgi:membrane-bound serine protease (ClpP class)